MVYNIIILSSLWLQLTNVCDESPS